jgi:GxxExxY protein
MSQTPKQVITDAPWTVLTGQIIRLAFELHNEIGPGHREAAYHNGMLLKLQGASLDYESEPYTPITLADGSTIKGQMPDFVVEQQVIVELKAHTYTMSRDEMAQVIGYFATLPQCPVALYFNFGRPRVEMHRLLPPATVQAYRRGDRATDRNG